ncbi:MAG: hypothetical protein KKA84_12175 [Bacteroidetes bacterium]|nr:hypothetical protein [Bacteroidota bacterium]
MNSKQIGILAVGILVAVILTISPLMDGHWNPYMEKPLWRETIALILGLEAFAGIGIYLLRTKKTETV